MVVGDKSVVTRVEMTPEESKEAAALVASLCERFPAPDSQEFLETAPLLGGELPLGVAEAIRAFRYGDKSDAIVISGLPVEAGPTPPHWKHEDARAQHSADYWLVLLMSQLGDAVSWSSLQDGKLVNNILPIAKQESLQTGHSSDVVLDLHIEDAFSDFRCDHLGLLALRNHDMVPTTAVGISSIDVTGPEYAPLFEPRYLIHPDDEHLRNLKAAGVDAGELCATPTAVLFGSPEAPDVRLDPPYMEALPGDDVAAAALELLISELSANVEDVALAPGEVLIVDNHRALHGRKPFKARYDGTDRWMRRLTTVKDLRKSRVARATAASRIIDPVLEPLPSGAELVGAGRH